ncbi:MAG TPA: EscU/YscU/HrcU family type III secretion system export apparatus switch protein [Polyangia bacterium]|jgi:type III secretion protein U
MAGSGSSARGEPTEEPTPQRLAEARRRGELAVSRPLIGAAGAAAAALTLALVGPSLWRGALRFCATQWAQAVSVSGPSAPAGALRAGLTAGAWALAPILGAAIVGALGVGLWQTRAVIVSPRLDWPGAGNGRGRGRSPSAALLVLGKLALLAAVAWATLRPLVPSLVGLTGAPPVRVAAALGVLAARLGLRLALALLALGAIDYGVEWLAHHRRLRMTRAEVQRQRRESEGDPRHRARRRDLHRALAEGGPAPADILPP